jgi:hypothetical protein
MMGQQAASGGIPLGRMTGAEPAQQLPAEGQTVKMTGTGQLTLTFTSATSQSNP